MSAYCTERKHNADDPQCLLVELHDFVKSALKWPFKSGLPQQATMPGISWFQIIYLIIFIYLIIGLLLLFISID